MNSLLFQVPLGDQTAYL